MAYCTAADVSVETGYDYRDADDSVTPNIDASSPTATEITALINEGAAIIDIALGRRGITGTLTGDLLSYAKSANRLFAAGRALPKAEAGQVFMTQFDAMMQRIDDGGLDHLNDGVGAEDKTLRFLDW